MKIIGTLDVPREGQLVGDFVTVQGWVLTNSRRQVELEIRLDGMQIEAALTWVRRPDVHAVHARYASRNPEPGFVAELDAQKWSPGKHTLTFTARSGRGEQVIAQRTIRLNPSAGSPAEPQSDFTSTTGILSPYNRLLLVHIPKTAGTSLTKFLMSKFVPEHSLTHAENRILGHPPDQVGSLERYDLVTAHLKLDTLQRFLDTGSYFTVTVLRDPARQLASHLSWINRLADPTNRRELKGYPEYIQASVDRLQRLGPAGFLDTLEDVERNLFDNCQTRYMLPQMAARIDDSDLPDALRRLSTIDLVGTTERFYDFLLVLSFFMGWKPPPRAPRTNVGVEAHRIDLEARNEDLQASVAHLTRFDRVLYRQAQVLFETRFRAMLKILGQEAADQAPFDLESLANLLEERSLEE